jgi:hypothetical protein
MLMKVDFPRKLFENFSNIEFDEERAKMFHAESKLDRQTDMATLTVAFRNVPKVPNKRQTSTSSAGFKHAISKTERPQTHVLDHTATRIGK